MSELKEYLFRHLDSAFTELETLSENAISRLVLYQNRQTGEKVLLLKTLNRNDSVFRQLNATDVMGYLPKVYIVASDDDALYVLLEYVEGQSAAALIGCGDYDAVLGYMTDVCQALALLHSLGIIHRDVKPDNVIIKPDGHAALIDLSIAKTAGEGNSDTVTLGTVGYAAPEQFGLMASRVETDIYALGVTMNILLTGVHPMQDIPDNRVGKIIKKCTSLRIADRYADVGQLMADLQRVGRRRSKIK
ncbi:MAG: protein kinase [Eubacterium sp.]|nr:protein kinase [Eubacterium sp.]